MLSRRLWYNNHLAPRDIGGGKKFRPNGTEKGQKRIQVTESKQRVMDQAFSSQESFALWQVASPQAPALGFLQPYRGSATRPGFGLHQALA